MFCALIMLSLGLGNCEPVDPRPKYEEFFSRYYNATPDCLNRDMHIRYLSELKRRDVQAGDNPYAYNHAIDLYVTRLNYYCPGR